MHQDLDELVRIPFCQQSGARAERKQPVGNRLAGARCATSVIVVEAKMAGRSSGFLAMQKNRVEAERSDDPEETSFIGGVDQLRLIDETSRLFLRRSCHVV